jgi:hypothetical protein
MEDHCVSYAKQDVQLARLRKLGNTFPARGMTMDMAVESLWGMPVPKLLAAYHQARRLYAERKFTRDTERARLEWQSAKVFVSSPGGVTERKNVVEASDELVKKGQYVRELTLDLDLLKTDIDAMLEALRYRAGAMLPRTPENGFGESEQEPLRSIPEGTP